MFEETTGGAAARAPGQVLEPERIRAAFPALQQRVHGAQLAYLDSAATTLMPGAVIDAIAAAQAQDIGSSRRGVHTLASRATDALERARARAARFLGADRADEVIFTRGTTEALNLVAESWARARLRAGDEVLVSELEHHANLLPWRWACEQTGARLVVAPVDAAGALSLSALRERLSARTRLVAVAHVSNVLGSEQPIAEIADLAHRVGAKLVVDGAQAAAHLPLDVAALDCDFYAFSGHKVHGPTGIGVLWGRAELLEAMPPYQRGGGMVSAVDDARVRHLPPPHRFEAGTQNAHGARGLAAALDFLAGFEPEARQAHARALMEQAEGALSQVPGLRLLGAPAPRHSVLSFVVDGVHAHDLGTLLDREGIAIRTGHMCAQPLMRRLGVVACARASLALHSTPEEIERLASALWQARERLT